MHKFASLQQDRLPNETTIFNFRHGLGNVMIKKVNEHLEKNGLMLHESSIVATTIIPAPSSTKIQRVSATLKSSNKEM